jgi:hypothetical protein
MREYLRLVGYSVCNELSFYVRSAENKCKLLVHLQRSNNEKIVATAAFLILSGCATQYGKYGIAGGYEDSRIDENTFSISVSNNGFTNQQTTSMHAMYRAAELTVENGYDYFLNP